MNTQLSFPTKAIITAGVVLVIAATSFTAYAHGDRDRDRDWDDHHEWSLRHGDRVIKWLGHKLELNEAQVTALEEIMTARQADQIQLVDDLQTQVKDTLTADTLSVEGAKELLELRHTMREKLKVAQAQTIADIHAVLTPEQRVIAADLLLEMRGHRGRHGDHKGKRGWRHWFDDDDHHDDDDH